MKKKQTPVGALAAVSGLVMDIHAVEHYDNWSSGYDRDLLDNYGYRGHLQAAEKFATATDDKSAKIMDFGCGTGLVGDKLKDLGFSDIDGADFSQGMLEVAKSRGCYQQLFPVDLTCREVLPCSHYDGAICAGLFGAGHLGAEHIPNLLEPLKRNSLIVIMLNEVPYLHGDYDEKFEQLSSDGIWRIGSNDRVNYMDELVRPGRLITAWKL